ncbi:MAG: PfkB family carbohydrate kinase, partial [Chthonomonadales bacterium]
MITTVTLNPAVDRVYVVPSLELGHIARPLMSSVSGGGKGINVSRAIHRLGGSTEAIALLAGTSGDWIADSITHEGIKLHRLDCAGESRTCIAIMDMSNGLQTELNEHGPTIGVDDLDILL